MSTATNNLIARWEPEIPELSQAKDCLNRLGQLSVQQRNEILECTKSVLSKCVDPAGQAEVNTGLVIGQVQSGKTLSFTTLAALAHDNGYRAVILFTGTKKNLRDQSTERLTRDLHADESRRWEVCRLEQAGQALLSADEIHNRLNQWDQKFVPKNRRRTLVFTLIKNRSSLNRLENLLRNIGGILDKSPFLIIDDECDQAGLNTLVREDEESATYAAISGLRQAIPFHSYVQYTATPQANTLISVGDHLSPNFVEVLEPGQGYCGGEIFFGGQGRNLREIGIDDEIVGAQPPIDIPESLREALGLFVLGAAVFEFQGDDSVKSMLVHPHVNRDLHDRFSLYLNHLLEIWETDFAEGDDVVDTSASFSSFQGFHEDLSSTSSDLPPLKDLIDSVRYVLSECRVKTANTAQGNDTEVSWGSHNFHILVGGQALERGFTIQGLTVTYMPRPLGVGNADGVQQRARFFGYREHLLPITRVFLPFNIREAFSSYVDHERHFRESIDQFSQTDIDFSHWTRQFLIHSAQKPTRRNVIGVDLWRSEIHEWNQLIPDFQNIESVQSFEEAWERLNHQADWELMSNSDWNYEQEEDGSKARHATSTVSVEDLLHFLEHLRSPQSEQYPALLSMLAWSLRQSRQPNILLALMRRGEFGERNPSSSGSYNLQAGRSGSYPGDRAVFASQEVTLQIHHVKFGLLTDGFIGPIPSFAIRFPVTLRDRDLVQQV